MTKHTYTCKNGDAVIWYRKGHTYMGGDWVISVDCGAVDHYVVTSFESFKEAEDWLLNHSEREWTKKSA